MTLENKHAVIFGAAGSLGSTLSRAFAAAGATVHMSGQNLSPVQQIADEIIAFGGKAETKEINALDQEQVNGYINSLVAETGRIDILFNAIGWQDTQNFPLTEMELDDFIRPVNIAMQTQFITCTAVARVMKKQAGGVILMLTATPGGIGYANVGGFGPACCAVEGFSKNLASELGPFGVRVITMRSGGSPDSKVFRDAISHGGDEAREFIKKMEDDTMLKRLPPMADVAGTAVFLASDGAASITGCTIDLTCGTTAALNYKVTPIAFVNQDHR